MTEAQVEQIVRRTVTEMLDRYGLDSSDTREQKLDLQHLRRWRTSVDQVGTYSIKTAITVIVTGFLGIVMLGLHKLFGN
jgi:hypothetical protein